MHLSDRLTSELSECCDPKEFAKQVVAQLELSANSAVAALFLFGKQVVSLLEAIGQQAVSQFLTRNSKTETIGESTSDCDVKILSFQGILLVGRHSSEPRIRHPIWQTPDVRLSAAP